VQSIDWVVGGHYKKDRSQLIRRNYEQEDLNISNQLQVLAACSEVIRVDGDRFCRSCPAVGQNTESGGSYEKNH
jgi:hypothetical protein